MSRSLISCIVFATIVATTLAASCKVDKSSYFTTKDATIVSQIGFISEFSLKCDSGSVNFPVYAEINGRITPVSIVGENKFQVSWTEEVSKRGERAIRLFDEEGVGNVRKVQRSGGNIQSVAPLGKVSIYHSGAFDGPWINSQYLASILVLGVAVFAYTSKSKVLTL